jgi:cell shape-determining protein MreC
MVPALIILLLMALVAMAVWAFAAEQSCSKWRKSAEVAERLLKQSVQQVQDLTSELLDAWEEAKLAREASRNAREEATELQIKANEVTRAAQTARAALSAIEQQEEEESCTV